MDPGLFEVFAVCYRVGDVFLGDDAYRLAGVRGQDHEGARARVLHNDLVRNYSIMDES
jgi:hypothetical protein